MRSSRSTSWVRIRSTEEPQPTVVYERSPRSERCSTPTPPTIWIAGATGTLLFVGCGSSSSSTPAAGTSTDLGPVPRPALRLPALGGFGFPSPFSYVAGPGYRPMILIYDTLLIEDSTRKFLPWLAKSFTMSPDGKTLGGTTCGAIQGAVMLIVAPFVGVHIGILGSATAMLELCVLAFAVAAMGVALAARMRSLQSFPEVTNFLVLPLFFLSGALFPLMTDLPRWLVVLTHLTR